jgi:hypothetical protein
MFLSSTIFRELVLSLAKIILKHSVLLCCYRLCGGVVACYTVACVFCAVHGTQHTGHSKTCCHTTT